MKQFEYKIINIGLNENIAVEDKILLVLNQYGKEGWLACSMNAVPKREVDEREVKVLLSREVSKRTRKLSLKEEADNTLIASEIAKTLPNPN